MVGKVDDICYILFRSSLSSCLPSGYLWEPSSPAHLLRNEVLIAGCTSSPYASLLCLLYSWKRSFSTWGFEFFFLRIWVFILEDLSFSSWGFEFFFLRIWVFLFEDSSFSTGGFEFFYLRIQLFLLVDSSFSTWRFKFVYLRIQVFLLEHLIFLLEDSTLIHWPW